MVGRQRFKRKDVTEKMAFVSKTLCCSQEFLYFDRDFQHNETV